MIEGELGREYIEEFKRALADPTLKYAGGNTGRSVVPMVRQEQFERYDGFVRGALGGRLVLEGIALMGLYVIWKHELYTESGFKTWADYVLDITVQPFGLQTSAINHKMATIDKALEKGVTVENIVASIASVPGATIRLVHEVGRDKLPEGGLNEALEVAAALGPHEALAYTHDLDDTTTIACTATQFDRANSRLWFQTTTNPRKGQETYIRDYVIMSVEEPEASWIAKKLGRPLVKKQRK